MTLRRTTQSCSQILHYQARCFFETVQETAHFVFIQGT